MTNSEKIERLKDFLDEKKFREFLIDLLKRAGFDEVQHTHLYGRPELGKDIIASFKHRIDEKEWYSFVVKHGRIIGNTDIIENIKNQIKQSFEYPYETITDIKIKINKVIVVCNENISEGAKESLRKSKELQMFSNFNFWWNEKLIELIDKYYEDFWLPGEFLAKEYTKAVSSLIRSEFEIKELSVTKLPEVKIKKLIDLFIEPRLIEISPVKDDLISKKLKSSKIDYRDIMTSKDNFIIEGDAGSGKSRLVNKLLISLLDPGIITTEKIYPIKLKLALLRDEKFDIDRTIKTTMNSLIPTEFNKINFDETNFVIFIDSMDDLYNDEIQLLLKNINEISDSTRFRFIITVRSIDNINIVNKANKVRKLYLQNFNIRQIQGFIQKYFDDRNRGKKLLEILEESNILDKLPTTPLTITLISILYEDTDYEIPATITDIYSDFVNILLGKLEVRSKVQLLDLELKKRIFSRLSFNMLSRKSFELEKDKIFEEIETFLTPKGISFGTKEELERLIVNSGLFYIDHNDMVGIKHLSFLEYFAAFETFFVNHQHEKLISNFNDVNWQNSAVFYAGFSKDMPWFIDELIKNAPNETLRDKFMNVGGMGYLTQALYMTDIEYRMTLVENGLDNMVYAFKEIKRMTIDTNQYKNMPMHLLGAMLGFWFNMNYRSITTATCLEKLFEKIKADNSQNLTKGNFDIGFKLFLLASTLSTKHVGRFDKLNELIDLECFIKDPLLVILGDIFIELEEINKTDLDANKVKKIKKEIERYKNVIKDITQEPAYRFGDDTYIKTQKRIDNRKNS